MSKLSTNEAIRSAMNRYTRSKFVGAENPGLRILKSLRPDVRHTYGLDESHEIFSSVTPLLVVREKHQHLNLCIFVARYAMENPIVSLETIDRSRLFYSFREGGTDVYLNSRELQFRGLSATSPY